MAALRSVAHLLILLVWRSQTGRDGLWHHSGLVALWFVAAAAFPSWLARLDTAQHRLALGESLEAKTILLVLCAAWAVFPFLSGRGRLLWRILPGLRRLPLSRRQRFLISLWGLVFSPYLVVLAVYSVPVWTLFDATPDPAAGRLGALAMVWQAAVAGVVVADLAARVGRLRLRRALRPALVLAAALGGVWILRLGVQSTFFEHLPDAVLFAAWDVSYRGLGLSVVLAGLMTLFIPPLFLWMDRLAQGLGPEPAVVSWGLSLPPRGGPFGAILGLGLVQSRRTMEFVIALLVTLSYGIEVVQWDPMPMETLFAAVSMLCFCAYPLLFNLFGFDGKGFQRYFLLPLDGRLLLLSKSAAVLLLMTPMGAVVVLLGGSAQGVQAASTACFMGMIQFLLLCVSGNRISVAKPVRRSLMITGLDQMGGIPGFLTALFAMVPVWVGTVLLMRSSPQWGPVVGGMGLLGAALLYHWSLKRTAGLLAAHRHRLAA